MKLEFNDKLSKNAIDVWLDIDDGLDRSLFAIECSIKWNLNFGLETWGISNFGYELTSLLVKINIEVSNGIDIESEDVFADVKFDRKNTKYICRIFKDEVVEGKWVENDMAEFLIDVEIEENPTNEDSCTRSQLFVKYVDLDLNNKKLTLTI